MFTNECSSPFCPDSRYALHVVNGITHKCQQVDDLIGPHSEFGEDVVGVVPRALIPWIEYGDPITDKLKEILIARDDDDVDTFVCCLVGQGTDYVVGFVALQCDHRYTERFARLVHPGHLFNEVIGHWSAVSLVIGVKFFPEGRTSYIERGDNELGLLIVEQFTKHRNEAINRIRGFAVRASKPTDSVVGSVHLRATVN